MKTYINGHGRDLRRLRHYDDEGAQVMAIHSGLSVKVAGHLIELVRNEVDRRALVVVTLQVGYAPTGLEQEAVKVAADLLAARARRFLGNLWTVEAWQPPRAAAGRSA